MTVNSTGVIGIIGGSGVYDIDALQDKQWRKIESSFGEPSDAVLRVKKVFSPLASLLMCPWRTRYATG